MNEQTQKEVQQLIWHCRFHPTDWFHEVGCPHVEWTKEQLQNAVETQKRSQLDLFRMWHENFEKLHATTLEQHNRQYQELLKVLGCEICPDHAVAVVEAKNAVIEQLQSELERRYKRIRELEATRSFQATDISGGSFRPINTLETNTQASPEQEGTTNSNEDPALLKLLNDRISAYQTAFGDQCREQRHLDEGAPERAYWHFGYAVALQDVIRLTRRAQLARKDQSK